MDWSKFSVEIKKIQQINFLILLNVYQNFANYMDSNDSEEINKFFEELIKGNYEGFF